jgi:hypothetical protein
MAEASWWEPEHEFYPKRYGEIHIFLVHLLSLALSLSGDWQRPRSSFRYACNQGYLSFGIRPVPSDDASSSKGFIFCIHEALRPFVLVRSLRWIRQVYRLDLRVGSLRSGLAKPLGVVDLPGIT